MSSKASMWLSIVGTLSFSLGAPGMAAAQEGDPYTIQAIQSSNGVLKAQWMDLRVEQVEAFLLGQTLGQGQGQERASARLHRQPFRWVANDARRAADGLRLTYLVDQADSRVSSGVTSAAAETAIDRAMAVWTSGPCLGSAGVVKRPDSGADADIFDAHFGYGGSGNWRAADVVLGGWLPASFFDAVIPEGGRTVLALSVTFIFVGADGQPTDIDRDGSLDTAASEIYFNDGFAWTAGGDQGFDIETVALHEIGHSLGIGHLGPPPSAVMNPVYDGPRRDLWPIDRAALCSVWASWPR